MTLRTSNQLFDAYFSAESMAEVFCDQGACRACWISKPHWHGPRPRSG